jgi:hypothetical protein
MVANLPPPVPMNVIFAIFTISNAFFPIIFWENKKVDGDAAYLSKFIYPKSYKIEVKDEEGDGFICCNSDAFPIQYGQCRKNK